MNIFEKIFSEDSNISVMRIMSVMSLLAGVVLACVGKSSDIVSIFVYAAFAGKAAQRLIESKEESTPETPADHPKK